MTTAMFEERGWEDALYPRAKVYAWRQAGGGLLIKPDEDDRNFMVLAGDPETEGPLVRLTEFEAASAALDFCDRIAPLAEWLKARDWMSTGCPDGLDRQMHEIAQDVTARSTP